MSKYIIRYKYGTYTRWNYFVRISREKELSPDTCSTSCSDSEGIMRMSLKEAEDKIIKIKKIRMKYHQKITEIQILNAETNKIINGESEEISRFELMDI